MSTAEALTWESYFKLEAHEAKTKGKPKGRRRR